MNQNIFKSFEEASAYAKSIATDKNKKQSATVIRRGQEWSVEIRNFTDKPRIPIKQISKKRSRNIPSLVRVKAGVLFVLIFIPPLIGLPLAFIDKTPSALLYCYVLPAVVAILTHRHKHAIEYIRAVGAIYITIWWIRVFLK